MSAARIAAAVRAALFGRELDEDIERPRRLMACLTYLTGSRTTSAGSLSSRTPR